MTRYSGYLVLGTTFEPFLVVADGIDSSANGFYIFYNRVKGISTIVGRYPIQHTFITDIKEEKEVPKSKVAPETGTSKIDHNISDI